MTESLGETEEVTEYRARNADAPACLVGAAARLPRRPVSARGRARRRAGRASPTRTTCCCRLPSHECVVGCRDFFPNEDESQYVLVLEDVERAGAAPAPRPIRSAPSAMDAKLRVIRDMLRGLAHAHANRVLHRALSPTTVLVTTDGRRRC